MSWLGEGVLTVLSSLILALEKEKKGVVLHTLKFKDKEEATTIISMIISAAIESS